MPNLKYQTGDLVYGRNGKATVRRYIGHSKYEVVWHHDKSRSDVATSAIWQFHGYTIREVLDHISIHLQFIRNPRLVIHDIEKVSDKELAALCTVDNTEVYGLQLELVPLDI